MQDDTTSLLDDVQSEKSGWVQFQYYQLEALRRSSACMHLSTVQDRELSSNSEGDTGT